MDENSRYYVYKHTSPSGKVYIGITQQEPEARWKNGFGYLRKNKHGRYTQPCMANAIVKYGWENFSHEILFEGLTREEAKAKEIELIAEYKSDNRSFGYNIEHGGDSVDKFSDETKRKISESKIGPKNAMYGKPSPLRRPVRCIETGVIYCSMREASEKTGVNRICISNCCRGVSITAGGLHWEYYNEELLCA